MYEIDIQREFSAAHMLKGYNGNCSALHGHNWTVQATVSSSVLDDIGIAVDFRALKSELDIIITELDHTNLNEIPPFEQNNPSSEQLAKYIFDRLSATLNTDDILVSKIRVCESPGSGATYFDS
jgi:6-pyruvoyltetrahydropterin/6-carboxytetrahydropterin synthase